MWEEGKRDEANKLYAAVSLSLQEATQRGYQSIAMPAISTGIFGFPLDKATEIILSASRDFLTDQSGTCISEVHIVDNDPRVISCFETALRSLTISSQPGPEEDHHDSPPVRRARAVKNADNAAGKFQCIILFVACIE